MPAYEYRCKECFHVFEVRASIKEYDTGLEMICPTCGTDDVVRMISAAGFVTAGGASAAASPRTSNGHSCGCGGGSCAH